MSGTNEFDYADLAPIEIPIKNLMGMNYVLKEADGEAGAKYKSRSAQCMKMVEGKVAGLTNIGSLEPYLLSLCMFHKQEDGTLRPVTEMRVNSWPAKVVKRLFNKAKEISELNEEETIESLEKTIEEASKKLEKLRGESVKKESDVMEDGSNSPLT